MLVFGGIVVAIVAAVFATVIVRGVGQWRRNNASPVVTTMARVVTKRGEVHSGTGESRAQTAYFATFEAPTGDRCELALPAREVRAHRRRRHRSAHLPGHPLQGVRAHEYR
jgi:Protein of unknown function (DUF2500)